jgi:hypothetical protein
LNNSTSVASSSKPGNNLNGKNKPSVDVVTISETISLTKNQHQALKIVCDIYQQSFSEYIQEALVQTMRSDIDDGNISIVLLERLDDSPGDRESKKGGTDEDNKKIVQNNDSTSILDDLARLNQNVFKPKISK